MHKTIGFVIVITISLFQFKASADERFPGIPLDYACVPFAVAGLCQTDLVEVMDRCEDIYYPTGGVPIPPRFRRPRQGDWRCILERFDELDECSALPLNSNLPKMVLITTPGGNRHAIQVTGVEGGMLTYDDQDGVHTVPASEIENSLIYDNGICRQDPPADPPPPVENPPAPPVLIPPTPPVGNPPTPPVVNPPAPPVVNPPAPPVVNPPAPPVVNPPAPPASSADMCRDKLTAPYPAYPRCVCEAQGGTLQYYAQGSYWYCAGKKTEAPAIAN
jgi:hypothetical protein